MPGSPRPPQSPPLTPPQSPRRGQRLPGSARPHPAARPGGRPLHFEDIRPDSILARVALLYTGLALYGASAAALVQSHAGAMPWDVLHQGIAQRTPLNIGEASIAVGIIALLLWLPLRQRPGLGTISNALLIGVFIELTLHLLPQATAWPLAAAYIVAGISLNAVATTMYIAAGFGAGPRDGLTTGLVRRTGLSIRIIRTAIELSMLLVGWLMGGTIGISTALYALLIGPLSQACLALWAGRRWRR